MSESRTPHLIERAVERMAELGLAPGSAPSAAPSAAPLPSASPAPTAVPTAVPTGAPSGAPGGVAASNPDGAANGATAPAASAAVPPAVSERERPQTASPGQPERPREIEMATLQAAGMVVAGARRSRVAEEWGVAAGRLMRTLRDIRVGAAGSPASNLLLVTSAKPSEGKTFSAINLAGSLILGGFTDVLLVDLDNKPGALTEVLGLSGQPGLYDLAADPALRPEDLVVSTALPGLCILPIGHTPAEHPGAADRTITRPVVTAIEKLARRFAKRLVILDSAPCLATGDASALAGSVGQIAFIVEAQRTQRDHLDAALELLRHCANISLILNKVQLSNTDAFGNYEYYNG